MTESWQGPSRKPKSAAANDGGAGGQGGGMKKDGKITLVCGFGRCGTSLVMRMLDAGGLPPFESGPPAYENPANTDLFWLRQAVGHAVKILDPLKFQLPPEWPWRFIWIDRDPKQQARSQIKFLSQFFQDVPSDRATLRRLGGGMRRDRGPALAMLRRLGGEQPLILAFEDILTDPAAAAARLSAFCGGLDAARMAAQVLQRPTDCLPYMLEFDLLAQEGHAK